MGFAAPMFHRFFRWLYSRQQRMGLAASNMLPDAEESVRCSTEYTTAQASAASSSCSAAKPAMPEPTIP